LSFFRTFAFTIPLISYTTVLVNERLTMLRGRYIIYKYFVIKIFLELRGNFNFSVAHPVYNSMDSMYF
jgi:hypothetical protein